MIDTSLESLQAKITAASSSGRQTLKHMKAPSQAPPDESMYQDDLLAALLISTKTRSLLSTDMVALFTNEQRRMLAEYLASHKAATITDTPVELQNIDTYVKIVQLKAEARYERWHEQDIELEAAKLLRRMTQELKNQTKDTLMSSLRDAELIGDEKTASELRTKLAQLIKETARGK